MTAVIDQGKKVKTIGGIEAYLLNSRSGTVELYQSPTEREVVDTHKNKVSIKDGDAVVMVFSKGEIEQI